MAVMTINFTEKIADNLVLLGHFTVILIVSLQVGEVIVKD